MPNYNKKVKLWRGTRAKYNALGTWDYWTEYNVKETNGTWTKYYGTKEVIGDSGELAPVEGVLTPSEFQNLPASGKTQGMRWLVGTGATYYLVEFGPDPSDPSTARIDPLGSYSVRVKNRGLKAYQIVNNELITYDEKGDMSDFLSGVTMNGSPVSVEDNVAILGTVITAETQLSTGTTSGSGNAVTSISVSGHQITLVKGETFATKANFDTHTGNTTAHITAEERNKWNAASGTVTSVNASAATNSRLSVSGGPITSSGTLTVGVASGYSIPSTGDQATWTGKQDKINDLDDIREGAASGASAIQGVKVNGTALEPDTDKVVDVTVPTALSALTSDSTHRVVTDTQINKWNAASGTVTSVNASGASGSHLSVTGGPITSAGTLTVGLENGYSIPSTTKQSEWDAASGTVTSVNASGASNSHLSVTGGPITSSGTLTVGLENGYSIPSTTKQSEWDAASGTVTSVNASAATNSHLSVTGGPITSAGTLTVGLQSGYSIPTTAKQSEWDAASGTVTSVNASGASGSHITVSGGPVTSSGTLTISLQSGYSIPTTAKQSEWDGKVDPEDIEAFFDGAEYNSTDKKIYFKHGSDVITAATIDASDFIKDGMVSNVEIKEGTGGNIGKQCLVITFNTDAGHSPIEIPLTNIFDPSNYYTKAEIDTQFSTETARTENVYVKKETGKGLSTNDYTDADKDKLDGIASGAQVNVIEGVQRNGTDLTVDANKKVNVIVPILTVKVNGTALEPDANKAVDVTVPTALSALTDDSTHRVVTDTQINKWDAASGTVTSVNASAVTNSHLSVTGGPITSAGTMGIGVASGYSIPSTGDQATWTAKQDALVSGENIKTINGESLLGSGNVETEVTTNKVTEITSASTDTQYSSAKAVYTELKKVPHNIPFVEQDGNVYTGTTADYTATCNDLDELVDGQSIIFFTHQGSKTGSTVTNSCTLNLTLSDGTQTGPKIIYLEKNTKVNANFESANCVRLVYRENATYSGTTGLEGWWTDYFYDVNSDTLGINLRYNNTQRTTTSYMNRYRLMFTSADKEQWVPANNTTSTAATSNKPATQTPIDPFGPIAYYLSTSAVNSGASPATTVVYEQYSGVTLGYSFTPVALTTKLPVYLKCEPQDDGSAIIDSRTPIVQTLPTTEDGMIYIFLGVAKDATVFELYPQHPVYEYKNGHVRVYQEGGAIVQSDWNQNDSSAEDYIKNRTHYTVPGDVYENMTLSFIDTGHTFDSGHLRMSLTGTVDGETIIVPEQNIVYSNGLYGVCPPYWGCNLFKFGKSGTSLVVNGLNPVEIPNVFDNNGYPTTGTVVIGDFILTEDVHKLDNKFLNLDSTLDSGSTNPVENRAIYNELRRREEIYNKVTEITSASTDTQYPSAKAVYDEISELDLVVAASLNDLNSRIKEALTGVTITGTGNVVTAVTENGKSVVVELGTANMDVDSALDSASTNPVENRAIYEYITNDELAISAALNALNDSKLGDIVTSGSGNVVTNIENVSGETIVTFGEVDATVDSALTSSSTNAVESRAIYKVIWEDEKVISAAFNDLNERKVDNSEIDGIINNLELEMSDITNEIDGLATSAITGVTTTGSGSVVTSISKTGNTLNVTMGSLEAETYSKAEVNAMIAALTARIEALENGS